MQGAQSHIAGGPTSHLGVREEEHRVLVLHSRHLVQLLEVLVEGRVVVAPAELYLETLVPTHVGSQPGQALLARASHAHQEGVAPRLTNHASYSVGGKRRVGEEGEGRRRRNEAQYRQKDASMHNSYSTSVLAVALRDQRWNDKWSGIFLDNDKFGRLLL